LRMFVLAVTKFLFYLYGWLWTLRPKRVGLMRDVLALFYLGFLGLDDVMLRLSSLTILSLSRVAEIHA